LGLVYIQYSLILYRYVGIYAAWGISQGLMTYLFGLFFAYTGTRAARILHEAAASRILRATTNFFGIILFLSDLALLISNDILRYNSTGTYNKSI
jgi:hypothetical protein